jgi:hypothetical protein
MSYSYTTPPTSPRKLIIPNAPARLNRSDFSRYILTPEQRSIITKRNSVFTNAMDKVYDEMDDHQLNQDMNNITIKPQPNIVIIE